MSEKQESEEFVASTISVAIPEFNEQYVNGKTVTFYSINVTNHYSKTNWSLVKRFSAFESLYKDLLKLLTNIPSIPKKTLFKVSSYEALTKRRIELEQFIKECVNRKDILSSEPFKAFLEIEKNSPELAGNAPTIVGKLEDIPLGVRDFYYSRDEGIVFMVCSDMNIISRVDSKITNIKLPWEKKTDSHVPVGAALCYKVQKLGIGFQFVKAWGKSFPIQTSVLSWDADSTTFSVGLDDGSIVQFKHEANSKYENFNEVASLKPHKERVMGIAFDAASGHIFSCSSDKVFAISDVNYQATPLEVAKSNFGYTNLYYDMPNKRVFLTNEGGELDVYLTDQYPLVQILNLQTESRGCIRGLHYELKRYMMFTCNTSGTISIMDLGMPGKEKMIKEISHFGTKAKLRVIRYDSEENQLFTGDEAGRVTVWSLKTGSPVYAWSAHNKKAITQMLYEEDRRLLWTGGKDRSIVIWQLPEKWSNEEIEKFEENEIKHINDNIALKRLQKALLRRDDDDSDSSDDDLNGWDLDYKE